jgi:aldehyde:ferredoxin oxidoreductase
MPRSFHNKILRINLTEGTATVDEPGLIYLRQYMGGWNVIADPLGPDNVLVFALGVLTGLAISGASRSAVGAKSPLTGGFGAAESGGDWGAQFKRAGRSAPTMA